MALKKGDIKRAVESLTRPDGEYFPGFIPERLTEYYRELREYALEPLMREGLTFEQAILIEQSARLHGMRCMQTEILDAIKALSYEEET